MTQKEREVLEQARDAMYCAFGLLADATVPNDLDDSLIEAERALRKALNATEALLAAQRATVVSLAAAGTSREYKGIDRA